MPMCGAIGIIGCAAGRGAGCPSCPCAAICAAICPIPLPGPCVRARLEGAGSETATPKQEVW